MAERKPPSKNTTAPVLERTVSDILVAENRSAEPFVKTFVLSGDNVTKMDLGTLVGVLEIEEKSEDSAYIVNFLASVAKKEYFSNPRRGPIESFEATLHKINVALTELVKHGNISWLGKLHGALGILEKNHFHFSVTGEGSILLFRGDSCMEISEGLASPEALEHPLKTFVEISSGRLFPDDTLILTSPELPTLFPSEILIKNRTRFGPAGFRQFLKTALVNELDMAATLVIDLSEGEAVGKTSKASSTARKRSAGKKLANVFSGYTFADSERDKASVAAELEAREQEKVHAEKSDYTDKKTGHIYVQGEIPVDIPRGRLFWESCLHFGEEIVRFIGSLFLRAGRSIKRQSMRWSESALPMLDQAREKASSTFSRPIEKKLAPISTTETPYLPEQTPISRTFPLQKSFGQLKGITAKFAWPDIPSRFRIFRQALIHRMRVLAHYRFFWFFLGGMVLVLIVVLFLFREPSDTQAQPAASSGDTESQAENLSRETGAIALASPNTLETGLTGARNIVTLNGRLYLVQNSGLADIQEKERYALPENEKVLFASAMDDLSLIFLYTESGRLFSWSPLGRNFIQNTLSLPGGSRVAGIGTYLTYLYVLDTNQDQIYRYPRTPAGFENATNWLRDSVDLSDESLFEVNESIVLASKPESLEGFFQGKKQVSFELPQEPLHLSGLFTEPEQTEVYGLDREAGRVLLWNTDGKLLHQYFHPSLKEAAAFGVDTGNRRIIVASDNGTVSAFPFEK